MLLICCQDIVILVGRIEFEVQAADCSCCVLCESIRVNRDPHQPLQR
jgi:hypothetical protein